MIYYLNSGNSIDTNSIRNALAKMTLLKSLNLDLL